MIYNNNDPITTITELMSQISNLILSDRPDRRRRPCHIPFYPIEVPFSVLEDVAIRFLVSLHGHIHSVRYCTVITHARVSVQVFNKVRIGCQSQVQCVVISSGLVSHLDQEVGTNEVPFELKQW